MDAKKQQTQTRIKTIKVVYPQVYAYTLPDLKQNNGSQKIGYTERKDVDTRINEQTHTAAYKLKAEKLWSAPAFFSNKKQDFNDKTFHKFLINNNIENRKDLGSEWFYFNGTPERSKELFDIFRDKGFAALQNSNNKVPYTLRTEQQTAVDEAKDYFDSHTNGEFLWNAKPRFGKTLSSYDLAKSLNATKVLIVTNRPAIANSWFDDFQMFIDGYYFISETSSLENRPTLTRHQFLEQGPENPQITFLSLQDLKGSKYFGGNHDKLRWIADLEWDLLIIDEAHEGVDTDRTDAAFDIIKRQHTLHLSGTPFKALANNKFPNEAIFNWTYLDEQKIKKAELKESEIGDHTDLPDMKLYTYRISQMIADKVNEGVEIDEETRDYAFDLNEFFATNNQKFVHQEDVKEFLKNLTTNTKYPFSTPELRNELRHTFWYVGNRVDSVKALEQLLKQDPVFKDYNIIVAAGDGKSFEEEENDYSGNEKSFDKVKKAIKENNKTITLSCGQLTTGVTIKEWTAVLMLTDIKTPAQYMQSAFRAQNPYRFYEGGQFKTKESAYLFDFAPTRVLEIYDQFANGLNGKAVNGEITESERKSNIAELLNFFPVISEDIDGQMIELDAEKVLTFPNAIAAAEIVKARFMTNLLFNNNIKGVFSFPKEVEEILDKMPIEKNKRVEVAKKELDLDDARKVEQAKQAKINENTGLILGEKIFRSNVDRIVDNALSYETPQETLDTLPDQVANLAEPVIAKYKEVYKATNSEIEEIKKEAQEKIKVAVAQYENSDIKDANLLKTNLANIIEHDIVEQKVEQKETQVVEKVQKTKEEEVREHLRAFTRTIPMFVMANSSRDTITIDNFDEQISDEDFIDLTNITKEEFHKLRDGFDYTDDTGWRQHFDGVFNKYKFNASIAEFVAEKQKRANYFETDEDIFELIPNQKNNQIFTPRKVVKMMIDGLQNEQPELFKRTDSTFIDLYMKSGMYITEIVKKLFAGTRHNYSSDTECLKHILENQVYGLAPTGVLYGITTSYIFGFDVEHNISSKNFVEHDLLPEAKTGTAVQKIADLFKMGDTNMKFDAVVGNPPYQDGNNQIYTAFYKSAILVGDAVSLIFPTGWQGTSNANMLRRLNNVEVKQDRQIVKIDNRQNAFPGVPGAEWTNVILWRKNYDNGLDGKQKILTEGKNEQIILLPITIDEVQKPKKIQSVAQKAKSYNELTISSIGSSRKPYGFESDPIDKPTKYNLTVFTQPNNDTIRLFGRKKGEGRTSIYIKRSDLPKMSKMLDKWKLFVVKAWGNMDEKKGYIGGSYSEILIAEPGDCCSEMYIEFGPFSNIFEAQNAKKYFYTKFFRAIFYKNKISQNTARETYSDVPLQNFTKKSDIDWSKSIPEVDQQLYKKYGLSQEEIDFIETRVKPMV